MEERLQKFLKKLRETGSFERRPGSGHPKSARTAENINAVEQLILSQEDEPGRNCSERRFCFKSHRSGDVHI